MKHITITFNHDTQYKVSLHRQYIILHNSPMQSKKLLIGQDLRFKITTFNNKKKFYTSTLETGPIYKPIYTYGSYNDYHYNDYHYNYYHYNYYHYNYYHYIITITIITITIITITIITIM